ncbi:hypothetical protein F66182_17607, partial [Fusarium sp. NRRL 66182]
MVVQPVLGPLYLDKMYPGS